MIPFADWLLAELEYRGWSRSEAARRGGISPSMMDKVIGGFGSPGLRFCEAMARAFGIPLEDVFRAAGILPPISDADPTTAQLLQRLDSLPGPVRQNVLAIIASALDLAQASSPSMASLASLTHVHTREELFVWMETLPPKVRTVAMAAALTSFDDEDSAERANARA